MKKVIFSLVIVAISFTANAQSKKSSEGTFKFGAGALIGLPVGDMATYASLAYGADLQGEYVASEQVGITLSAGYLRFAGKSGFTITGGLIPVLAGVRVTFADKIYGSAQLGVSLSTESGGGSAFTYAPGIGYKVSDNFDLLLKYQAATKSGATTSFIGVRAGFTF